MMSCTSTHASTHCTVYKYTLYSIQVLTVQYTSTYCTYMYSTQLQYTGTYCTYSTVYKYILYIYAQYTVTVYRYILYI